MYCVIFLFQFAAVGQVDVTSGRCWLWLWWKGVGRWALSLQRNDPTWFCLQTWEQS